MRFLDKENAHGDCDAAAAEGFSGRALIIASNRGPITFDGAADLRFRRRTGAWLQRSPASLNKWTPRGSPARGPTPTQTGKKAC
jgi:hypothetical protein